MDTFCHFLSVLARSGGLGRGSERFLKNGQDYSCRTDLRWLPWRPDLAELTRK